MTIQERIGARGLAGPAGALDDRRAAPPSSTGSVTTDAGDGGPGASAPLAAQATSTYVQYLPSIYHGDPFVGRFLMIFESILAPIERQIDTVADTLDPRLAPAELLPWLASWVGVELDETWPLDRQRELVARAATLYRWRGTRRGLRQHLAIYTGHPALIVENFTGLRLGHDAALGLNTQLGAPVPDTIAITLLTGDPGAVDAAAVQRIVAQEAPAHTAYTLDVFAVPAVPDVSGVAGVSGVPGVAGVPGVSGAA